MRFIHCPYCGDKLIQKEIGDEGEIPYCQKCEIPIFDLPYTCTITLVVNELQEVALIKQDYVSTTNFVCVAGYIKSGESAEETAAREVFEELGIPVDHVTYMKSYYYERKDMLMLGFIADVRKTEFHISGEVDKAAWFTYEEALTKLKEGSIAMQLLKDYIG